jgi:putative tryptophan/tyrosine transport system substrate-binding protein
MIRRREFIAGLGGAAVWPLAARAQQPAMPVIGYLNAGFNGRPASLLRAFRQGLQDTGYVEGRNVFIEYRGADGQYDRLPELAAELANHPVKVIVATGSPLPALAAKSATATIPIVFQSGADPIAFGLVTSFNRPGGNVTGITTMAAELGSKRLQILHEVVPTATIIALLVNPNNPSHEGISKDVQTAARALGLDLHVLYASVERDFDKVFATLAQLRAGGLVIAPDPFFIGRSEQLAALTLRYAIPTTFQGRDFVEAGGLMSFGGSFADSYQQVGVYTGRILKGEKPGDLPVQQATKVELIINLKTARAVGVDVPQIVLIQAGEVIE